MDEQERWGLDVAEIGANDWDVSDDGPDYIYLHPDDLAGLFGLVTVAAGSHRRNHLASSIEWDWWFHPVQHRHAAIRRHFAVYANQAEALMLHLGPARLGSKVTSLFAKPLIREMKVFEAFIARMADRTSYSGAPHEDVELCRQLARPIKQMLAE